MTDTLESASETMSVRRRRRRSTNRTAIRSASRNASRNRSQTENNQLGTILDSLNDLTRAVAESRHDIDLFKNPMQQCH